MTIRIALAGNPNAGKTTLFNALTGARQSVGNWPGVTVEKKEGRLKNRPDVTVTDLPGIYSLSPYSLEEIIARNYLLDEKPDVILNIVDGTNLERNLYLTTQLLELGIPVVVAINMMDVLAKSGDLIDTDLLGKELGCVVTGISALKETGVAEAIEKALASAQDPDAVPVPRHRFSGSVEHALAHIEEAVLHDLPEHFQRGFAIRLFERDGETARRLNLSDEWRSHLEQDIRNCEEEMDNDSESIIATERYNWISGIMEKCCRHISNHLSVSDRIDAIVTNRFLGLPIFAAIMSFVYYVSVTSLGGLVTDWTNDELFGKIIPDAVKAGLVAVDCAEWLQNLILDGIIAGTGAVLGFVPQILILFAFLAFMEYCGYMARIAFILDRVFHRFGLSGKSFISILIGTGCGVPGIMSSRTIENERDRKMTIITTTFIPCSAKLPIIALFSGALFAGAWWVAPAAYFTGIGAIIISGIILKKTRLFAGDPAPFVMELPPYRWPTIGNILRSMWERGSMFIRKAGTIILLSTIFVWFVSKYGFTNGQFGPVEDMNDGLIAVVGNAISWIFSPLGWGDWKAAVATITGLVAKENVVGTFGILFGFAEVAEDGQEIWGTLATHFSLLAAWSFLVFNLLCAPCFAAIGAIRREMNSAKWTFFAISYQTGFAWCTALCMYQFGNWILNGVFGFWTGVAIVLLLAALYLLFRSSREKKRLSVAVSNTQGA